MLTLIKMARINNVCISSTAIYEKTINRTLLWKYWFLRKGHILHNWTATSFMISCKSVEIKSVSLILLSSKNDSIISCVSTLCNPANFPGHFWNIDFPTILFLTNWAICYSSSNLLLACCKVLTLEAWAFSSFTLKACLTGYHFN